MDFQKLKKYQYELDCKIQEIATKYIAKDGRKFIGCDISEKACEITYDRISKINL